MKSTRRELIRINGERVNSGQHNVNKVDVSETYAREASRLGRFIRGRVADAEVAEEIMQDVFADWIETEQLLAPIEHIVSN